MLYDDNFGHYECDGDIEETMEFYNHIQETNVEKECTSCGKIVMIQPHYAICNSCADRIESGHGY